LRRLWSAHPKRWQAPNWILEKQTEPRFQKVPQIQSRYEICGLRLARLTVCLYGPTTYTSKWVDWELRKSVELGKPIMGVCLYGDGRVRYYPAALEGRPRVNWNVQEIVRTMRQLVR
jgi:hypothetical protein